MTGSGGQLRGEQLAHPLLPRKAFRHPEIFDRAQDAGDFGPGLDPARDDLAAFEREGGDGPALERGSVLAAEEEAVEGLLEAEAIGEGAGVRKSSPFGGGGIALR